MIHLLVWFFFWGNRGIVLWLLGLLELIEMHTQCPLDSQASSVPFLGDLWDCYLASWDACVDRDALVPT